VTPRQGAAGSVLLFPFDRAAALSIRSWHRASAWLFSPSMIVLARAEPDVFCMLGTSISDDVNHRNSMGNSHEDIYRYRTFLPGQCLPQEMVNYHKICNFIFFNQKKKNKNNCSGTDHVFAFAK